MSPWFVDPVWQNFSSLYREAVTAREAKTEMERSHHLTASIYFGVAALEAFLNQKMRRHLTNTKSDEEILEVLRKGKILKKLSTWPLQLLGKNISVNSSTMELLSQLNSIRGDLTHPKTHGREVYKRLEEIDPNEVVDAVAEYLTKFHESEGTRYPYWIFGWNYLNPRPNSYEIFLVNDQQFGFSLQALGFQIFAASYGPAEAWKDKYMKSFEGYKAIAGSLRGLTNCEPKFDRFPFQPKLCQRWWTSEHHRSCGHVTEAALEVARNYDVQPRKK